MPVAVNGVSTKALIDTGSPATIISIDFILKVLARQQDSNQTIQQWKAKFLAPCVSLQNYGEHRLDIPAQIRVTLS
jgi:hypothetical protein